jgi:hypothetical protein
VALVSEPRLVVLRERLEAERADGAAFSEAWPRARTELLDGLGHWWRELWLPVLNATEDAWRRAYEGGRSSRVECAVTELEAYADSGLEPLRYELPLAGA